jgi:phospholipid transport system substrate-binding protein
MKKLFGIFTLFTALLFAFPAWTMAVPPDKLVDQTVQEVIDIIRQDEDLRDGNSKKILDLVENKIIPHFNFTRMTRLAMGKNWRNADTEQQDVIIGEFRDLLVRTYSNTLSKYQDEKIIVSPLNALGDNTEATVKTEVVQGRGKRPVPIDYNMEKTADGWKVYDVIVAGVSLVMNYRGSFNSQVSKDGVDGLIKTLVEKNRSLEEKYK